MSNLILDSLEIRNFRGFKHLQIERLARVNLIVGKNNVGKSSLLEAIQLYASRAATPTFIWEILSARNEIRQRFVNVEDMLSSLKYLFYGRKMIRPGVEPIYIGPINAPADALSIAIDWSTIEIGANGSLHTRPLKSEEYTTAENIIPRFAIQVGGTVLNYPIDPSLPQGIVRLNAKEITCTLISPDGLKKGQMPLLWDTIALTSSQKEVLNALRFTAPGVEGLHFVSAPIPGKSERDALVKISDIEEPLPLSGLGDGMQRMLGIALALVNAKNGIMLIDEFENGLYYSVQTDLWDFIFRMANQLNVQVFATTHSWDCIKAFQQAASEDQHEERLLLRLESKKDEIRSILFDESELEIVTREQIEVR